MKLLRYGEPGAERPGVLDDQGQVRDLSGVVDDIDPRQLGDAALDAIRSAGIEQLPVIEQTGRLGPPVGGVRKIICIGLNYSDHAAESGLAIPKEPVVFMKADTSASGPMDDVVMPRGSTKLDWEVELGVVIGTEAKYVDEARALDHVAGYCVVNDISERAFQIEREGQWVKGKSHDTFCPFGPVLTTRDEVSDPQALGLWLSIDGERVQDGNTSTMIFSVAHIVSYLSQFMTLRPGDLISTGTPPGVGLGFRPPRYLAVGQRMQLGIESLGEIGQSVVQIESP